jgi:hypothetical protein
LPDEQLVKGLIAKRERLLKMRTGRNKLAGKHKVAPEGVVRKDKPRSVVALTAQQQ